LPSSWTIRPVCRGSSRPRRRRNRGGSASCASPRRSCHGRSATIGRCWTPRGARLRAG
jgi:hypothetical protein